MMLTIKQTRLLSWLKIAQRGGAKYEKLTFTEVGHEHGALDFILNAGYTVKRDPHRSLWTIYL